MSEKNLKNGIFFISLRWISYNIYSFIWRGRLFNDVSGRWLNEVPSVCMYSKYFLAYPYNSLGTFRSFINLLISAIFYL